jgi:hypothetical protein
MTRQRSLAGTLLFSILRDTSLIKASPTIKTATTDELFLCQHVCLFPPRCRVVLVCQTGWNGEAKPVQFSGNLFMGFSKRQPNEHHLSSRQ